ncbi:MAG TPA: VWA domain-containing protein [Isosphaeraceae bacterium]|nr:VWA domain-containing protein [Isosphaeraceae bacterium]
MTFAQPQQLWLLLAFPVLVLWAFRGRLRRRRGWEALAQRGRAPREGTVWWLGSVACLIVALAQPKWGRLGGPPPPPGHDVILVIDVSRSMGVEDAVPNRLAVAREAAASLVDALIDQPADRAAVVAFAGRGVLRCPLTENLGAVLEALQHLQPGGVQPGGTDLGAGLDAALEAIDAQEHAQGVAVVVFSDGEDLADRWRPRLERLLQQGVVVHAVTVGDNQEGHPVPSGAGSTPLVYHGEPVRSRRDDSRLEEIAHQTGGAIIRLGLTSGNLGTLYRTRIEPAVRQRRAFSRPADQAEQFPLFLIAAAALLLAGCWPPGRGWSWRGSWTWPGTGSWRRLVKALPRAAIVLAVAGATPGAGQAPTPAEDPGGSRSSSPLDEGGAGGVRAAGSERWQSAAEAVARGRAAYASNQFAQALAAFEAAILRAPTAAVPRYNAAAVLFQLKRYDEARGRYLEARQYADRALTTKIDYALGNTALAQGDLPTAISAYTDCISSTARGADLDTVRHYAQDNRAFAIAQAQSLAAPQGPGAEDPPQSRRPDRRRAPQRTPGDDETPPEGQPEAGTQPGGLSPDDVAKAAGPDRLKQRRRRIGAAGGSRTAPPGAPGESPEDRLETALENIRAAQKRRLPDEPPPASAHDDRKDW